MPEPFRVWHHNSVGSTNDIARDMAAAGAPHATVIHADEADGWPWQALA